MRKFALLSGGILCFARVLAAPQTVPLFRTGVDIVQLAVSVIDRDHHPVLGLTLADFTILEDGKPRPVVAFAAIDAAEPPVSPASTVRVPVRFTPQDVAFDGATNALPEGRLFVLLIDDAMLPTDPKIVDNAKKIGRSVIAKLGPTDQMAVVFSEASRAAQGFTGDRAKLLAAVQQTSGGRALYTMGWDTAPYKQKPPNSDPPGPRPTTDNDIGVRESALRTLEMVSEALVAAPQRQKILIYVTPGIPVNPAATSPVLAHGRETRLQEHEANLRLWDQLPALFREMQRANVRVYPVDPCGVGGLEMYIANRLAGQPALSWPVKGIVDQAGDTSKEAVPIIQELAHFAARLDLEFVETAAGNTGGRAIVGTDDFEPGLAGMFQENGSYYLLGFSASDPGSGRFHRLSVKVTRPGVEVLTRSAYYATDAISETKLAKAPIAERALSGPLPHSGLSLSAVAAPFAAATRDGSTVAVVMAVHHPSPAERTTASLDVEVRTFTADGLARGGPQNQTVHLTLSAGAPTDVAQVELLSHLDLKPGRYQMRMGVHSSIGDTNGSVYVDVDVPDFANAPVSMSGIVLEARPSHTSVPTGALAAMIPVVPTTEREFSHSAHASVFLRLYQGGTPPPVDLPVRIQIIDQAGAVVVDRVDTIAGVGFGATSRSADEHIALPISELTSGEYLLTIETTLGRTTARRDVRFSVK